MKCLSKSTIEIKGTVHPIGPLGTAGIANNPFELLPKPKISSMSNGFLTRQSCDSRGGLFQVAHFKISLCAKKEHSTTAAALNLFYKSPYLNFLHILLKSLQTGICVAHANICAYFKKCKISLTLSCFVPNNSYQFCLL